MYIEALHSHRALSNRSEDMVKEVNGALETEGRCCLLWEVTSVKSNPLDRINLNHYCIIFGLK